MKNKSQSPDIYVATETFTWENDVFQKGRTHVRAGHPSLKANPQYFKPIDDSVHFDVEQMTAAPGERRGER